MRNKRKKHLKQLRLQISRMKRAMKRNSKKYKLRRRHHLENRKRGITARRIWESKDYINKEVPKNFSFINNTDEVLKYFVECKSLLHKKEKVQCDLSHITSLSSDAIALLAACTNDESFLGKRGSIRGNAPEDLELLKLFIESGFYNHVKSAKKIKSAHKSDMNLFHQESNYQVQSDVAKKACILGTEHVFGSAKPFPDLYEMLIESMSNTNNHASHNTKVDHYKWWLYTYNAPGGRTMYTFIDLGVGIFDSIPVQTFKSVQKFFGIVKNEDLVKDLLDGKIKSREKVDNNIRGKGIPQITTNSSSPHFARAYIISNDVKIDLKNKTAETLNSNFSGTLLFWELTNGNVVKDQSTHLEP